jgi:streptogramin lyase
VHGRLRQVLREPIARARRTPAALRVGVVALGGALASACGASSVNVTAVATQISPTPAPTPSTAPTSSVPVSQLLSVCPKTRSFSSLPVFAQVPNASDLAVAADGSVWVTSQSQNQVLHLSSTGATLVTFNEPSPTGVAVLPSGNVLIAEQGADLIVELDPSTLAVTSFLQLTPDPPHPQISGFGLDVADQLVLVPDTAQSRVLTVPFGGGTPSVLISGIGTPDDAALGSDGAVEVSQAAGSGILSVPLGGGGATKFAQPPGLLGLAVKDLLFYVTQPASHSVLAFNPATGHTYTLITGVDRPEGIAVTGDGQLLIADSTSGTVAIAPSC